MTRLENIFSRQRKALVIFDACGAPDMEESEKRLETIIANGADIVELGIPFSDPVADGPVIQRASQQALAKGATLKKILEMAARLRARHPETGLIVFGYFNVFLQYGLEALFARLEEIGIDGILIVDLPFEERQEIAALTEKHHVPQIPLVAPSTTPERAAVLVREAKGFVYCINARGVTGERTALPPELAERLETLRRLSPVPVAAGFGISGPEEAASVCRHADAAVVGSAAVKLGRTELGKFVAGLKEAVIKA